MLLRHNEMAGEWHDLCASALTPSAVSDEPLIYQGRDQRTGQPGDADVAIPPEDRGDIAARGFWKRSTTAVFDVRIVDTDAPTYRGRDPKKILAEHEKRKKDKHLDACLQRRRQFTPLVFSVDGLLGPEAQAASQRLASRLAAKWVRPYSHICGYVRSRLSISLVRSTSLCLRGARGDPARRRSPPQWECGRGLALH